jgi:hypothetical protein
MVEKRTVGIILAMILVVVVAAYFIFKVLGLQPEKDIFPKDKDMLVRYYACSLAICTHGCDWLETNKICLDNDTFTHECNLWCHDVCVERFGDCDDEDRRCCGPEYNLTVSLVGNPLLGCYPHYGPPPIRAKKNEGHSDIYNHWYTVYGSGEKTFYDKLIETEGVPKIIGPPDESILKEGCKRKLGCSGDALYMHFPGQLRTGDEHFVYCSGDKAGIGHIFLDPLEAHEKFGCFGDCSMALAGGDRNSFDECRFQGEINMWADWEDDQCADVYFNSTISGGWDFFITCTDPINPPPDWCKQRINLGETSDPYTIVIDNQLGSGKKFILQVSDNQGGEANCILWKDDPSEEIDRIFVGNGETEEFYMSCTPIETGTYSIWIDAWPRIGYTGKQTQVELVASDFSWEVEPKGDQPPIRKDDSKRYTVEIDSGMGVDTDFVLSLNVPGGLTCKFDENDDVTYTLSIPDDGFDSTTFTCSGDPGEYDIVIRAEGGGINKPPKTRHLTIHC